MAKIRTVELADGAKRYRFTADIGPDPVTGKRRQRTFTYRQMKEAKAELARIGHQARTGEYVERSRVTVSEVLDAWLVSATFEKAAGTARSYSDCLRIPRERLGPRRGQSITRADIEALRDWALAHGRSRGGKALAARTVRAMLRALSAAFSQAERDGLVAGNPCRYARMPSAPRREFATWTEAEARTFMAAADGDRLAACWRLSAYGLRRGEVLGLRWADVGVDAGVVSVAQARVLVGAVTHTKAPKSVNGIRRLPLDPALVGALKALQARQGAEMLAAGEAYQSSGYVAADELGQPLSPEWYSSEFGRLCTAAGVRKIRLHDMRHTACSQMHLAGVPVAVIARWAGHHSGTFTMSTYVHAGEHDLAAAMAALSAVYGTDVAGS